MLQAHAGERVRVTSVGALRCGPSMFVAASFVDAPPPTERLGRVAFLTTVLPTLSITAALAAPQTVEAPAFGGRWRLSAAKKKDGWLVVRLELLAPPPDVLTLPVPAGAGGAGDTSSDGRLLPVNLTVLAGTDLAHGVLLDSHAVFGVGPAHPASWCHVIYLDKLRGKGLVEQLLRVTLQAVRVLG